jgi:hypothetical protein
MQRSRESAGRPRLPRATRSPRTISENQPHSWTERGSLASGGRRRVNSMAVCRFDAARHRGHCATLRGRVSHARLGESVCGLQPWARSSRSSVGSTPYALDMSTPPSCSSVWWQRGMANGIAWQPRTPQTGETSAPAAAEELTPASMTKQRMGRTEAAGSCVCHLISRRWSRRPWRRGSFCGVFAVCLSQHLRRSACWAATLWSSAIILR